MVAAAPIAAAGNVTGAWDKIAAFIATAKSSAADGLTWAEFGQLLVALLRIGIESLDGLQQMSGKEKRDFVLEAVGRLFDAVADKAIPAALWPVWLLARPAVRSLILAVAAGAIEQLLPLVRAA